MDGGIAPNLTGFLANGNVDFMDANIQLLLQQMQELQGQIAAVTELSNQYTVQRNDAMHCILNMIHVGTQHLASINANPLQEPPNKQQEHTQVQPLQEHPLQEHPQEHPLQEQPQGEHPQEQPQEENPWQEHPQEQPHEEHPKEQPQEENPWQEQPLQERPQSLRRRRIPGWSSPCRSLSRSRNCSHHSLAYFVMVLVLTMLVALWMPICRI